MLHTFKFQSNELKSIMQVLSKVRNGRLMPILDTIHLQPNGNRITATASDGTTQVSADLWSYPCEGSPVCVPFNLLNSIASQDGDTTIRIDTDSEQMTFTAHIAGSVVGGALVSPEDFPLKRAQVFGEGAHAYRWAQLKQALASVDWCRAKGDSNPTMICTYINDTEQGTDIVAVDGRVLTKCTINARTMGKAEGGLMISPELCKVLLSIEAVEATIEEQGEIVAVSVGGFNIIGHTIAGRFPNYNGVLPKEQNITINVNRGQLISALARVAPYINQSTGLVKLTAKTYERLVSVEGRDIDFGTQANADMPAFVQGENIEIGLQIQLLVNALAKVGGTAITIKGESPERPITITGADERTLVLIMPMSLKNEDEKPAPKEEEQPKAKEADESASEEA